MFSVEASKSKFELGWVLIINIIQTDSNDNFKIWSAELESLEIDVEWEKCIVVILAIHSLFLNLFKNGFQHCVENKLNFKNM